MSLPGFHPAGQTAEGKTKSLLSHSDKVSCVFKTISHYIVEMRKSKNKIAGILCRPILFLWYSVNDSKIKTLQFLYKPTGGAPN